MERENGGCDTTSRIINDKKELYQFPCSYPLKVVGVNTNEFYSVACAVIEKHVPDPAKIAYSSRVSAGNKYLSITATFEAQNYDQLTAIYGELSKSELVVMTL